MAVIKGSRPTPSAEPRTTTTSIRNDDSFRKVSSRCSGPCHHQTHHYSCCRWKEKENGLLLHWEHFRINAQTYLKEKICSRRTNLFSSSYSSELLSRQSIGEIRSIQMDNYMNS